MIRITREVRGVNPLGHSTVTKNTAAAIPLHDLNLEPLLIRASTSLAIHLLPILEKVEWCGIDCVTPSDAHRHRTELDKKELLLIVPGGNPSSAHSPACALL